MERSLPELEAAAKTLAAMEASGFHLFPLRAWNAKLPNGAPAGKLPRDKGFRLHRYHPFNWRNYMRRGGNVGAGANTNHIILDVDPRNGGLESFEWLLFDSDYDFADCPKVMSGKGDGGFHLYMCKPPGLATRRNLKAYPGLDFQCFGFHVVAPGSLHPKTGEPYTLVGPWHTPPLAGAGLLWLLARPARVSSHGRAGALSYDDLRELLAALDASDFGLGGANHDEWLDIAMAAHHGTGGDDEAKDIWLAWCATDPQYGEEASDINGVRWDSFDAGRDSSSSETVTYKTLLQAVVRAGKAQVVARLHRTGAATDFDNDDVPELMARLGVH